MKRARDDEKEIRVVKRSAKSASGDLLQMFDDGTEIRGEMSFMDLPDDILINIFKLLDFPSRLKLRLNRRLEQLQLGGKNNCESIELSIYSDHYYMQVTPSNRRFVHGSDAFNQLEKGLARLALNTSIRLLSLHVIDTLNEQIASLVDTLSNFQADTMDVRIESMHGVIHPLPQVTLSTLLNLAQNVRDCTIENLCPSVSVQDLCTLRKKMLEDDCKLKYISVGVEADTRDLVEAFFGVTVEYHLCGGNRAVACGHVFKCEDSVEELELYWSYRGSEYEYVNHFEGDLRTSITRQTVIFNRSFVEAAWTRDNKVDPNHLYPDQNHLYPDRCDCHLWVVQ